MPQLHSPPHATAIHRAGALLPFWWAEEGDRVIVPEEFVGDAGRLCKCFSLCGSPTPANGVKTATDDVKRMAERISSEADKASAPRCQPWGWSLDAARQMARAGFTENLPSDAEIERLRNLSHRRSSIHILEALNAAGLEPFPVPMETTEAEAVIEAERQHPGCFIKSPWSGSGRGVFCALSLDETALRKRAEGIIHRQGSVIVERGLAKTMDFAALFYSHGAETKGNSRGRVEFRGFSIFKAEARGMYSGNIVAPQHLLAEQLAQSLDMKKLMKIIACEEKILSSHIGESYRGPLGIDMMIYDEDGETRIMPCVELNLRMTMGVAAMEICSKLKLKTPHFLAWEHRGDKTDAEARQAYEADIRDGGTILLPPTDGFTLRLKAIRL